MIKKLIVLGLFSVSAVASAQQKFSIIPSVGYAWRTAAMPAGISNDERNYIKGLKSGLNFDVSAYYNVKNVGIGLKYSSYHASSDGRLSVTDANGNRVSANVSTEDQITFWGPALMYSTITKKQDISC